MLPNVVVVKRAVEVLSEDGSPQSITVKYFSTVNIYNIISKGYN